MKETPATGAWQKAFDYNYLGTYIIPTGVASIEVTISKISDLKEAKVQGKLKDVRVIYFKEFEKPMILNKENSKRLAWNFGVKEVENWVGRKAMLYADPEVDAFGSKVEALRFIKNQERGKFNPDAKQKLDISSPNFESLATWLLEKESRTLENLKGKYDLTPEAEAELIKRKNSKEENK